MNATIGSRGHEVSLLRDFRTCPKAGVEDGKRDVRAAVHLPGIEATPAEADLAENKDPEEN